MTFSQLNTFQYQLTRFVASSPILFPSINILGAFFSLLFFGSSKNNFSNNTKNIF